MHLIQTLQACHIYKLAVINVIKLEKLQFHRERSLNPCQLFLTSRTCAVSKGMLGSFFSVVEYVRPVKRLVKEVISGSISSILVAAV